MHSSHFITLQHKTIVITGGTSGIGYQLVKQLCTNNTVLVIARSPDKLRQLQQEFPNIQTFAADLSQPNEYTAIAEQIQQVSPNLDVLINNAAVQYPPQFLDSDFAYKTIQDEIHVHFTAICSLSYLLLPALLANHENAIIANINSGLCLAPKTSSAVYCATKGAMNIFSKSLGYQLVQTPVRVIQAVLPLVETPMTEGRGKGKIPANLAATAIIQGIEQGKRMHYIGKARLLKHLLTFTPWLAHRIMKHH